MKSIGGIFCNNSMVLSVNELGERHKKDCFKGFSSSLLLSIVIRSYNSTLNSSAIHTNKASISPAKDDILLFINISLRGLPFLKYNLIFSVWIVPEKWTVSKHHFLYSL
ncbi:MAG: hypothetical protein OXM55_02155, partial [Bdellovibrionales bacterium]|nr:hypothetical protein [Bdellovibrionales bacterium]